MGLLVGASSSLLIEPTYVAKTQLFVATQNSGSVGELQQGNTFTQARVQSYVKTATTPAVLQPAIDDLGLQASSSEFASKISANVDSGTVILNVQASDRSPVQAAAMAQAVAESLVRVVEDLEKPESGSSPVRVSVITPATAPGSPSAPNVQLYVVLGLLTGLVIGLAVAVIRALSDNKIKSEGDLRKVSDVPLLGGLTYDSEATINPLLTQVPSQSPRAEAFRQIRTNLQFAHVSRDSKSILISSSLPAEGKSTTSTNLAIALAASGQSTVLVDADLRRPMIDQYLGLERNAGLTTALLGNSPLDELLQPWGDNCNLQVLTSGPIPPNPSELLGSAAMKALITELEQRFDAVIIDAPPLLPVTDAAVLSQHVGGVVLVVGSSKVRLPDLEKAVSALKMVHADLLGVILNLMPAKGPDAYSYSYYSYESNQESALAESSATRPGTRVPRPASRFSGSHVKAGRRLRRAQRDFDSIFPDGR